MDEYQDQNRQIWTSPRSSKIKLLALVTLLVVSGIYLYQDRGRGGVVQSASDATELVSIQNNGSIAGEFLPRLKNDAIAAPELSAKAYLVYDVKSRRILASYNHDLPLPIASLTKLTSALLSAAHFPPDEIIEVDQYSVTDLLKPTLGLVPGEKIPVSALIEGMLVASANDAAQTLAYAIGNGDPENAAILMNELGDRLGLQRTRYANLTGFDNPNAYSTALDVLTVVIEVKRNPWLMSLLSETKGEVRSNDGTIIHKFNTTNSLLKNGGITAGKTGFTDEARGNLVAFAKTPAGDEVTAIILGSESREVEMVTLLTFVFEAYEWR